MWLTIMIIKALLGDASSSRRLANGLGLWDPRLGEHYSRLWRSIRTLDWADLSHALVNIPTEWNRLDAQRGWKVMADLCLVLMLVEGLALWLTL